MSNIPRRRFVGFSEPWEQRKLEELATFSKGSGYSKGDLTESGVPIILYGRLYTKYETEIDDVDTYVNEIKGTVYSQGGEVIVPASGETAEDIARASSVVKSGILLGGDLNIIHPNEELNPCFLALTISNGNQQKELSKKAQGKSVVHIHNEDLREVTVLYPTLPEQQKIGVYFRDLDKTITLHQHKLDKLKALKQAYLMEMLPQEGETVPRRRFAGFTEPWERRKLGDIAPIRGGFAFKSTQYKDSGIPIVRISNILDNGLVGGDFIYHDEQPNDRNMCVYEGDALLAMSGATTGKVSVINGLKTKKLYQNQRTGLFQKTIQTDYSFVKTIVQSAMFKKQLNSVLVTGAQPNISPDEVGNFSFYIPVNFKEQKQIGAFFKKLDDTITLCQQKLDKLKTLKQAYLVEMFPQEGE